MRTFTVVLPSVLPRGYAVDLTVGLGHADDIGEPVGALADAIPHDSAHAQN
jgi:hypothetical protein